MSENEIRITVEQLLEAVDEALSSKLRVELTASDGKALVVHRSGLPDSTWSQLRDRARFVRVALGLSAPVSG